MKRFLAIAIVAVLAAPTFAGTRTIYQLSNHSDGNARPPLYGLRLDGLVPDTNKIWTFDFRDTMFMSIEHASGDIRIYGSVFGGENDGNGYGNYRGEWEVDFTYSSNVAYTSGSPSDLTGNGTGTRATVTEDRDGEFGNTGSIKFVSDSVDSKLTKNQEFQLIDEDGKNTFAFRIGYGHRSDSNILSGWGWLNHTSDPEWDNTNSGYDNHIGASDWLFHIESGSATVVPEPGSLAIASILGVACLVRRPRRIARLAK